MSLSVLILGSGAREHALGWKIHRSPELEQLFCAPGNPGTASVATNVPIPADDIPRILDWIRSHPVDLVVVGPEGPLVQGVADELTTAGIPVFGPSAAAAALEGSKAFAKEVMASAGVPTAKAMVFDSAAEAEAYVRGQRAVVVKADGLAAGKGVAVARGPEEAIAAIRSLSQLGDASKRLIVEEVLEGEELSVIALCDGERFVLLPPAQDHKRVGDGDLGPNTGGMGAFAPAPFLDASGLRRVGAQVIEPVLREMARRGSPFRWTDADRVRTEGPRVQLPTRGSRGSSSGDAAARRPATAPGVLRSGRASAARAGFRCRHLDLRSPRGRRLSTDTEDRRSDSGSGSSTRRRPGIPRRNAPTKRPAGDFRGPGAIGLCPARLSHRGAPSRLSRD
jgi:hypothetical protein